jgi:hypothetical protein
MSSLVFELLQQTQELPFHNDMKAELPNGFR